MLARPRSINVFAVVYLLYALIELFHGYLMRDRLQLDALRFYLGDWTLPVRFATRFAIILALAWLVYFKKSKIGRVLIILEFARLLYRLPQVPEGVADGNIRAIVWLIGFIAGVVALSFLFTRESRYYFASKGGSPAKDAAAFE